MMRRGEWGREGVFCTPPGEGGIIRSGREEDAISSEAETIQWRTQIWR